MSKKRWLIVPLCAALCSQGVFAQTPGRKILGINETVSYTHLTLPTKLEV